MIRHVLQWEWFRKRCSWTSFILTHVWLRSRRVFVSCIGLEDVISDLGELRFELCSNGNSGTCWAYESFRRFQSDWPHDFENVSPRKLADNGFVYTGIEDHVKCFACGKELQNWEEADNIVEVGIVFKLSLSLFCDGPCTIQAHSLPDVSYALPDFTSVPIAGAPAAQRVSVSQLPQDGRIRLWHGSQDSACHSERNSSTHNSRHRQRYDSRVWPENSFYEFEIQR